MTKWIVSTPLKGTDLMKNFVCFTEVELQKLLEQYPDATVEMKDSHLEDHAPLSLTDDQQVVLKHLKSMCPPKLGVSAMVTVYCLVDDNINDNWQEYSEEIPEHIEALQKLSVAEENQVLRIFSAWALEQEEE